ncbi:MAG: restriction endonuclease subunit S [Actinomycetia bacterium]|nr:restriction endonuclease subunit S [Actinomycetes bacterium]
MSEWAELPLGDIANVVDCEHKTAPAAATGDEYGYSVGTPNIRNGRIEYAGAKRVSRETFDAWSRRAVPGAGDLILAREAPVGQVARVDPDRPTCLGQRTVLVRPDPAHIAERYLHAYLLGQDAQRWMADRSAGSTVAHLNVADVRAVPIAVPPLDDQFRIASILGAIDDMIETNRELVVNLWQRIDGAYEMASAGGQAGTLGNRIELRYGKGLPAARRVPGPYPVVSSAGIVDTHQSSIVRGPGVVVGRKGTVGSVTWIFEDFFPIDTAFYVDTDLPMAYVYVALRNAGLDHMNTDSAVPGLNRENALTRPLIVPGDDALAQFAAETSAYLVAIHGLSQEIAELTSTRDDLLPLLIAGKVRVQDVGAVA